MTTHAEALSTTLFDGLYEVSGYVVDYHRGNLVWNGLQIVKGGRAVSRFGGDFQQGYLTDPNDDFIVRIADWRALTSLDEPERLDRITWTDEKADQHEFSVGEGTENVFRDLGGLGVLWRIHTHKRAA